MQSNLTQEELKIKRLQKKCAKLRERSVAANKEVRELKAALYSANKIKDLYESMRNSNSKEASLYRGKYYTLLADIKAANENL